MGATAYCHISFMQAVAAVAPTAPIAGNILKT